MDEQVKDFREAIDRCRHGIRRFGNCEKCDREVNYICPECYLCDNASEVCRMAELLLAERDRLKLQSVTLWECPDCGFEMHPKHARLPEPDKADCPACGELRVIAERDRLAGQLERLIDKCVERHPFHECWYALDDTTRHPDRESAVAALLEAT